MRYLYTIVRKQNPLYFGAHTGNLITAELYKNYSGSETVVRSNFDFHTERTGAPGIGSKIIYLLAALVAALLPVRAAAIPEPETV